MLCIYRVKRDKGFFCLDEKRYGRRCGLLRALVCSTINLIGGERGCIDVKLSTALGAVVIAFAVGFYAGGAVGLSVLEKRMKEPETQVFVLTDDGVYETEVEARRVYEALKALGVDVRWEVESQDGKGM